MSAFGQKRTLTVRKPTQARHQPPAPVTGRASIRVYPIRLDLPVYRELCFGRYGRGHHTGTAVHEIIEERCGIEVHFFLRTQAENFAVCERVEDQLDDHSKALTEEYFGYVGQSRLHQPVDALRPFAVLDRRSTRLNSSH